MRTGEPGAHVPSTRGRKRKNPLQPSTWDPANAARANMPRASGSGGQQASIVKRPYYNLVFGTEPDEDVADSLVDTLDVVTPRDLSAARYAQNHELLEHMMQPPPSAYGHMKPKELEAQLAPLQHDIEAMEKAHAERLAQWQSEQSEEPAEDDTPDWAQAPGAGPILGVGHIRADVPAEIAAQLAARREPTQPSAPDAATRDAIAQINRAHGVEGEASGAVSGDAAARTPTHPGTPVAKTEEATPQPPGSSAEPATPHEATPQPEAGAAS
ncbi:hypothetical protein CBS14141_000837 [Malassezia furfur]|nr:hypothetical protein CBS14141_000837 [Malassezia furfur]